MRCETSSFAVSPAVMLQSFRVALLALVAAAPPHVASAIEVPAGTIVRIQLLDGLSSQTNQSDDPFNSVLAENLVINGRIAANKGSPIGGRMVEVMSQKKMKYLRKTRMSIELESIEVAGRVRPIVTSVTEIVRRWDGALAIEIYQAGYMGSATTHATTSLLTDDEDDKEDLQRIAAAAAMMKKIFLNRRMHIVFEPGDVLEFFLHERVTLPDPEGKLAEASRPSEAPRSTSPRQRSAQPASGARATDCEENPELCAETEAETEIGGGLHLEEAIPGAEEQPAVDTPSRQLRDRGPDVGDVERATAGSPAAHFAAALALHTVLALAATAFAWFRRYFGAWTEAKLHRFWLGFYGVSAALALAGGWLAGPPFSTWWLAGGGVGLLVAGGGQMLLKGGALAPRADLPASPQPIPAAAEAPQPPVPPPPVAEVPVAAEEPGLSNDW